MTVPFASKALCSTLIIVAASIFGYYFFLMAILPLFDVDHDLHKYFPDPFYAVAMPLLVVVLVLSLVCVFTGVIMLRALYLNYHYNPVPTSEPSPTQQDSRKEY